MGSVQSSPKIWRMILVQFITLYRMVKVLCQCDLSFRSSDHKLPGGTINFEGSMHKLLVLWGQFSRAPRSDVWFWYSLMCSIEWLRSYVSAICRSRVARVDFCEFWHFLVLVVHFLKKIIFRSWVSSNQFVDLTHSSSTVWCALSNG